MGKCRPITSCDKALGYELDGPIRSTQPPIKWVTCLSLGIKAAERRSSHPILFLVPWLCICGPLHPHPRRPVMGIPLIPFTFPTRGWFKTINVFSIIYSVQLIFLSFLMEFNEEFVVQIIFKIYPWWYRSLNASLSCYFQVKKILSSGIYPPPM